VANGLFGNFYVVPTPSAVKDGMDLFPKYGDYQEARRQILKLAFWPRAGDSGSDQVQDLDWEWVKGLGEHKVGELRIADRIGGYDNLRVIFHVTDVVLKGDPMPRIWVISVLQKKSQKFTARDLQTFKGRVRILRHRHYS